MQRCDLTLASWNCMLTALLNHGKAHKTLLLFRQMQQEGFPADARTFAIAIQVCCKLLHMQDGLHLGTCLPYVDPLQIGMALHVDVQRKDLAWHPFVGGTLLNLYGKLGCIANAEKVFAQLGKQDVVCWTTMLAMYVANKHAQTALRMYKKMLDSGVPPSKQTFVVTIQACGKLAEQEEITLKNRIQLKVLSVEIGRALHEDALRMDCADVYVGSALVNMYGKCGALFEAEQVFDKMCHGDVVTWNAMLSAYVEQQEATKALQLFSTMQKELCVSPNEITFVAAIQACSLLAATKGKTDFVEGPTTVKRTPLEIGRALHLDARRIGLASHAFVGSALVTMYGKCGSVLDSEFTFHQLSHRNVVTWNAMLSVYVDQEQGDKVLSMYQQMLDEGVYLSDITVGCVLNACSETCCLEVCRETHCAVVSGLDMSASFVSIVIHAYGGCSSMEDAQAAFGTLSSPDIVPWNALGAGHSREGNYTATLSSLYEMQLAGLKPDDASYLSILSVCNHSGFVVTGLGCLEVIMQEFGKIVDRNHFISVVDLLGRAGDFSRIEHLWFTLQEWPDLPSCLCLLRACQTHGNVPLGKWAFDQVMLLQCREPSAYVLMSNIYAEAGLWSNVRKLEETRHMEGYESKYSTQSKFLHHAA